MATTTKTVADANEPKMVRIRLFKDGERYKDDLPVILNGKCWMVKRGVAVEVPEAVAEIIEQQMEQDTNTAEMISRLSNDFKEKSKKYE